MTASSISNGFSFPCCVWTSETFQESSCPSRDKSKYKSTRHSLAVSMYSSRQRCEWEGDDCGIEGTTKLCLPLHTPWQPTNMPSCILYCCTYRHIPYRLTGTPRKSAFGDKILNVNAPALIIHSSSINSQYQSTFSYLLVHCSHFHHHGQKMFNFSSST